jgi:hypothetical protein
VTEKKEVIYRGGVVRFAIPRHWVEEYEPEGGGTYYANEPGSGTLRLNVLTLAGKGTVDESALLSVLRRYGSPESLGASKAVVQYIQATSEDGVAITLFHWQVAGALPPRHIRLAIFSYTVETARAEDPRIQDEVRMLDEVIRAIEFAPELGNIAS